MNKTVTGLPILECPALRFCWVFYFWLAGYTEYGCEDEGDGSPKSKQQENLSAEECVYKVINQWFYNTRFNEKHL